MDVVDPAVEAGVGQEAGVDAEAREVEGDREVRSLSLAGLKSRHLYIESHPRVLRKIFSEL